MSSTVQMLHKKNLIPSSTPDYVINQTFYEVMMGSIAYGVSSDTSDVDIYGVCFPDKDLIFPHLSGEILGFGREKKRFEQWQQHHIIDKDTNKEYDISIYNIVKYFQLCLENNPNMIDSLFVPQRCVLHCTRIGTIMRDNRKDFLHKGSFFKYKGYSYGTVNKIRTKHNEFKKLKELLNKYNINYSEISLTDIEQELNSRGIYE